MKVGRNAPCPCGSGKKFKQCCGRSSVGKSGVAGDTLATVQALVKQGRHAEAEAACARMMSAGQGGLDVLRLRADLLAGANRPDAALALYQQLLVSRPKDPVVLYNAGTCAMNLGDFEQAVSLLERAHRLQPSEIETQENLGIALAQMGRFDAAVSVFSKLLERAPQHHSARLNLVNALAVAGRLGEADQHLQQVLKVHPNLPQALAAKGLVDLRHGHFAEARAGFEVLLAQAPDNEQLLDNLEAACSGGGDWPAVIALLEKRGASGSTNDGLRCRLAKAHAYAGDLQTAETILKSLPASALVYRTLALCYREFGRVIDVVTILERLLDFDPGDLRAHESLLMMRQYLPGEEEAALVDLARDYGRRLQPDESSTRPAAQAAKRLRIGFVSADLRQHSVGYFMLPLLQNLDRSIVEVFVYDNNDSPDDMSAQMREWVDDWRYIDSLNDAQAEALVREDKIQILIDLSGLTQGNRLGLFARQPAPFQVTWLGYPATTGVPQIDFRLTDHHTDPVGMTEQHYTEKLWRLPNLFSVYMPPQEAPPVAPLPLLENGVVTFGSFNNFNKLNHEVLQLWAQLLNRIEGARLVIKAKALKQLHTCEQVSRVFEQAGVDTGRLTLLSQDASLAAHLARYGDIDVALDCFPYSGTTTTCEALWMGVPVLTLAGRTHRSRVGLAQLQALGLTEWVAASREEYLAQAAAAAEDSEMLQNLRSTLREKLRGSRLTDAKGFAEDFVQAMQDLVAAGKSCSP